MAWKDAWQHKGITLQFKHLLSTPLSCHLWLELSWKLSVTLPIKNVWACDTRFSHMCQFQMASKRQQVMPTSHTRTKWWPTPESPLTRLYAEIKERSIKEEIRTDVGEGSTVRERGNNLSYNERKDTCVRIKAMSRVPACSCTCAHIRKTKIQIAPSFTSYPTLSQLHSAGQTPLNLIPLQDNFTSNELNMWLFPPGSFDWF